MGLSSDGFPQNQPRLNRKPVRFGRFRRKRRFEQPRRIFPEQFVMDFDAGKRRIQIGCKIRLSAEGQHRDIVRNRQPLLPHRPERRTPPIIEAQKTAVNSGFFRPISSDSAR